VHRGVEPGALGAQGDAQAVASRDLVGEEQQEEVLMRHLLLPREHQAVGERV